MTALLATTYCAGKIGHATAAGAYEAMRIMRNRRKFRAEKGAVLNVYRCKQCQQWHVGNTFK